MLNCYNKGSISTEHDAVENLNNGSFDQYGDSIGILEKFKSECDADFSKWVAGPDGLPQFEWE